jgi:hypothetical protein
VAGIRRHAKPTPGVREALIAKLSGHARETVDPRLYLVPKKEWPSPTPPYVDHIADLYDDLVTGKAVNVPAWQLRGIADVPPGCHLARVDADGTCVTGALYRVAGDVLPADAIPAQSIV